MVNQVQGEYKAKDVRMVRYFQKVKNQLQKFNEWKMIQITREENVRANALAGVAASLAITQIITLNIYYQDNSSIFEKK